MPTTNDFQQSISAAPNDPVCWHLWADWLEENGAGAQAEIIRLRSELTQAIEVSAYNLKEFRIHELLYYQGIEPPVVSRINSIGMELHLIPPGVFTMGDATSEVGRPSYVSPVPVTLTQGFWIGRYLVTQRQYQQIRGSNPSFFKTSPQHPVEHLNYQEALSFCQRLTEQEVKAGELSSSWHYTLPTDAQWEYACRAGNRRLYYFSRPAYFNVSAFLNHEVNSFADEEMYLADYAWFWKNADRQTHPVGCKRCNGWGLHDMHGNVWEWCLDWYVEQLAGGIDPIGPAAGSKRVVRGGDYLSNSWFVRTAARIPLPANRKKKHTGFRIALVPVA